MRLIVERKFEGWRREHYEVDEADEETIKKMIVYDIEPLGDDELLYDTFEDTGTYEVIDENRTTIIASRYE